MLDRLTFNAEKHEQVLGGRNHVFHCHHYNSQLQKTIEEGLGEDADAVLQLAAQECVREQLSALCPDEGAAEVLSAATTLFSELGFGRLDFSGLSARGGEVVAPSDHYALSWLAKFGERDRPASQFVAGFIAAAAIVAHRLAPERVRVTQTACPTMGGPHSTFLVEVL